MEGCSTISNFTRSRITEKKAPEAPKVVDLLEGLTANKQDVLKEAGLVSLEAFAKESEADVLALKGIGPAAIKQLVDNGAVFAK
ncbi:hypothetical protein WA05_06470 [Streptococcus agalactiae]|nr:hypothetical protein WA02_09190 [Streptococcus agalactiae]KLL83560.1 hypothetical protein WA05_06470 [Streptococcus agalactiae]